ncbi:MAG: putative signal transduction protein [Firmicutes bacterium]|nr:putative signal transduction protein [Bacillota bacterium]
MGKSILLVDDEKSILASLERLFFDSDFEVSLAESGEEGLEILANQPIDIVISDMRMPVMDGHQFLRKVKERFPWTTRIILSGYASENELFETIIDGSSSLYLLKPWDGAEFKDKIGRIFEAREMYRNLSILEFANKLENLSMITGVYNSVCRLIEKDADVSAIARVIETDPTVAASVLRVVNSAFYNIKTGSIIQAITYLGLPVVKSIVLSCNLLQTVRIQVPPFNLSRLARHATHTNMLTAAIYTKFLGRRLPDNLATAGLLHNIGFVMLLHYFPEKCKIMLQKYLQSDNSLSLSALEKEEFGITHAELGGHLLDWWGLPYPIVECALFHDAPLHSAVIETEAVVAVHLASHYAWAAILPKLPQILNPDAFRQIGTTQQQFEQWLHDESKE